MMQTIDEADYDQEVRKQAANLADAVGKSESKPLELVSWVLDDHPWFADGILSGADYGAIVKDFDHFAGDPIAYRDPATLTDSHDFDVVLRRMAYGEFEADVIVAYKDGDYEN